MILTTILLLSAAVSSAELETAFLNPPRSAKPHTWYHMMNGNVTKAGITRDFEALAEEGFGGVQMFDAGCEIPPGGLDFNSPEWFDLFCHAASEARRLGLEICIPNCSGWSSSGGPWNPPSNAMKRVVFTETRVSGPSRFSRQLPREKNDNGFYEDIAVLAFPVPAAELVEFPDVKASYDGATFTLSSERPFSSRGVSFLLDFGWCWGGDAQAKVEVADDGTSFRPYESFRIPLGRSGTCDKSLRHHAFPAPLTTRAVRVTFQSNQTALTVKEARPEAGLSLSNLKAKTFELRMEVGRDTVQATPDQVVSKDAVRDLTDRMGTDGTLTWDVPEGKWTILRIGYMCNGRRNHPASDHGIGLEVDKLSAAAMDFHFEQYVARLCRTLGPLAGKVETGFNNILVDSYEVGSQNWTQGLDREFRRRRGYDIRPYLPVFAGHLIGGVDESERFLEDFRRVVADLFAENYAGALTKKCRQYGLLCSIEPYGSCPADNLQYGQYVDIPMGEFWSNASNPYLPTDGNAKFVSYIAHVWGKPICGTESFTASPSPQSGRWMTTPFGIKAQGDLAYSDGVNRFIYHRFTHQPWADDKYLPGMTMGRWGMHLDRTQTWWPYAKPFFRYQTRCQYMLQRGTFVADALFFAGEEAPNQGGNTDGNFGVMDFSFRLPQGYDGDICPTDAMYALKVEDGEVVVPGGVRYRMLVIPPFETMTPKMASTIARLQREGAKIVWPAKPVRAPGLACGANADAEVRRIADGVFAAGALAMKPDEALKALNIAPQVSWRQEDLPKGVRRLNWIHRNEPGADWFFVALPTRNPAELDISFRIAGREPEIWDAETGVCAPAAVWREEGGRTVVKVPFDVCGSKFVVFRKAVSGKHVASAEVEARPFPVAEAKDRPVFLSADYGADGKTKDISVRLNRLASAGFVDESVGNDLAGGDPAPMRVKRLKATYVYRGVTNRIELGEHARIVAPTGTFRSPTAVPLEFAPGADGQLKAWAWQSLKAALTESDGTVRKMSAEVPAPVTLAGPWEVLFPNGFLPNALAKGADEKVVFDELGSWSDRKEDGIRYFSGSATYRKRVTLPADTPKGARIVLDLGDVREVAEVTVNGKTFDALWRPPFRVDITEALAGDAFDLRIRVANLWANRLIGDDRTYAPDCEWRGEVRDGVKEIGIKAIPQWVKDGKPSPTGRHTFTTWKHWTKDDEPLVSGLLGPVRMRVQVGR